MAKKKSKEELDIDDSLDLNDEEESSGGNKLLRMFQLSTEFFQRQQMKR